MATPIRPFLSPSELEVLIVYHLQKAVEAEKQMKESEGETQRLHYLHAQLHRERKEDLEQHRSVSG